MYTSLIIILGGRAGTHAVTSHFSMRKQKEGFLMDLSRWLNGESEDARMGARGIHTFLGVAIILAVCTFGDVMYIFLMQVVFAKQGFLLILCYVGAFSSLGAVGYLLLGKFQVFRPGAQMIVSWIVAILEIVIIGLNLILAFNPSSDGFLGMWASISPATPIFHMAGVFLVMFLSPELKAKHHEMELTAKEEKAARDTEHTKRMIGLEIQRQQLKHLSREAIAAVNAPDFVAEIRRIAQNDARNTLLELGGYSSASTGKIVDALPSPSTSTGIEDLSLKQTASTPTSNKNWTENFDMTDQEKKNLARLATKLEAASNPT